MSLFTKKHHKKLAEVINDQIGECPERRIPGPDSEYREAVEHISDCLAEMLAQDNEHFDRIRFLTACGIKK